MIENKNIPKLLPNKCIGFVTKTTEQIGTDCRPQFFTSEQTRRVITDELSILPSRVIYHGYLANKIN